MVLYDQISLLDERIMERFSDSTLVSTTTHPPTASRRGLFLSLNSNGNVVDTNDEMWYTYGTKIDKSIENTPSDSGHVRKVFSQCSLKPKGALV